MSIYEILNIKYPNETRTFFNKIITSSGNHSDFDAFYKIYRHTSIYVSYHSAHTL